MPSVYAHYRFGNELTQLLPEDVKSIITKHRELYNLGLQGPDILFFYHPVFHNYVNRLGHQIHLWKGRRFFQTAVRQVRCQREQEESIAYLCGVVCHYALDSICHPYVNQCVQEKKLSHTGIEGSFERLLLVEDHLPLNYLITNSLKADKSRSEFISQFYGKATGEQLYRATRTMILCNDGLRLKDSILKRLIFFILRLIGKYESISGMVITDVADSKFADTDRHMRELYNEAKATAVSMINELLASIRTRAPLSSDFDATFMG
jgi:hypothetical protein